MPPLIEPSAAAGPQQQAIQKRVNIRRIADLPKVIDTLQKKSYLPAIWFILSRRASCPPAHMHAHTRAFPGHRARPGRRT